MKLGNKCIVFKKMGFHDDVSLSKIDTQSALLTWMEFFSVSAIHPWISTESHKLQTNTEVTSRRDDLSPRN
jgi:hypothetical protein